MSRHRFGVAIATVFVATFGDLCAQSAASARPSDPEKDVRAACTHRRMMVRRAASGKVAQAGDDAVPALRKVADELGLNRMPLELVDALSKAEGPTEGPMVELLTEWASTRTFYWRALSLDGLVTREVESARPMFRAAVTDVSHLMRISGARGLLALGPSDDERKAIDTLLDDEDPRVRARVAMTLVESGDGRAVVKRRVLEAIYGFERQFGDDPWGAREAQRAERALRKLTGERYDALFDETAAEERANAERLLSDWSGIEDLTDMTFEWDRGTSEFLEIRSCRNGDLFVQWDAEGRVFLGLDAVPAVTAAGAPLLADLGESLEQRAVNGRVVCDFIRTRGGSDFDHKSAPEALPKPLADGLKRLASVLDESEKTELSKALTQRLRQFETPDDTR